MGLLTGMIGVQSLQSALKDQPSASMTINVARHTYPAGRARDWAMLFRSDCCCLVINMDWIRA